jgi:NAD(P)H-hydrate repair Nnr-like enzyme with NAD(P)H-hydrate dehydratase domain
MGMNPPAFYQQNSTLLYPKILWNRPLSRHGAGRLLIIGGYKADFSQPTAMFTLAMAAGAGECMVVLPDSLARILAGIPSTIFVPSSPSGSLGRDALAQVLDAVDDANGVALGANLSNNSESAVLVERMIQETSKPLIVFGEVFQALQFNAPLITKRDHTLLILTMPEVFKLASQLGLSIHIRRDGGLMNKLEIIQIVKAAVTGAIVVYGAETIVAVDSEISVTPTNPVLSRLPTAYYSVLSVFWLQHPLKPFEALTTAAWVLSYAGSGLSQQELPTVSGTSKLITKGLDSGE